MRSLYGIVPVMLYSHNILVIGIMMLLYHALKVSQCKCSHSLSFPLPFSSDDEVQYDNCTDGQIKLSGGSTPLNGRAEICYNNVWFGICPTHQNLNNNNAFCRTLGYAGQGRVFLSIIIIMNYIYRNYIFF